MEKITYEKLSLLSKDELLLLENNENITYDMLPNLTLEESHKLYPEIEDYFNGIYGKKFAIMFKKEFNLSPTREIANFKGYLNYLKDNIIRIKGIYNIDSKNLSKLDKLDKTINDFIFDGKLHDILLSKKIKEYINYLTIQLVKIEDKLKSSS